MIDDVQQYTKIAESQSLGDLEQQIQKRLNDNSLLVTWSDDKDRFVVVDKWKYDRRNIDSSIKANIEIRTGSRRGGKVYIAKMKVNQ